MGVSGKVFALAVGGDGSLYVGGNFATAGDTLASRVARWDGMVWRPLGSGMDGDVYALAVAPNGSLYAGGLFTTAGGVATNHVARWDGTAWHTLGSGIGGGDYPKSVPWRLARTARSTPEDVHHGRRGGSQRHRPLGWNGMASPGQRDEARSTPWRLGRTARSMPGENSPRPVG